MCSIEGHVKRSRSPHGGPGGASLSSSQHAARRGEVRGIFFRNPYKKLHKQSLSTYWYSTGTAYRYSYRILFYLYFNFK